MVCDEPGVISNGYTTSSKSRYTLYEAVGYICHQGYNLAGSPIITCNGSHWSEKPTCTLNIESDVWFWLLIVLGLLITIAVITGLCLYFTKRHRYRRNRVRAFNSDNENYYIGCCGGCCDYGGSFDVCVDYYGCCSLNGCCGYFGICSCCFGCCRCCREPLENNRRRMEVTGNESHRRQMEITGNESHRRRMEVTGNERHRRRMDVTGNVFYINHKNVTSRVSTRWEEMPDGRRLSKKTYMNLKRKRQRMLKSKEHVSDRVFNQLNEDFYPKVRKEAKQLDAWLPFTNPVRNINTSTK